MFSGLIDIDESSEENDEDFYKNESSGEENKPDEEAQVINTTRMKQKIIEEDPSISAGTIPGSKPGIPTKLGPSLLQTQNVNRNMADSLSDFQNSIASRGSSKDSKRDFRIKNSSTNTRAPAQKRTTLMAMNKPH